MIKKYAAILFLLLTFPLIQFFAGRFMLEADNNLYSYIPQESDFVVEINTRNFIRELAYQRIFNETYFKERIYPAEEGEEEAPAEKIKNPGFDLFSKVILFREQWANETVWIGLISYNDADKMGHFFEQNAPDVNLVFGDGVAILQLTPSTDQAQLDQHLEKIKKKEIKRFTERVNLTAIFDAEKEINCFIIPKTTENNQLIDGYLSFDFSKDHIAIDGTFSPVSGFKESTAPIAYAINEEKALSLRSSLNLLNSIYWFSEERLDNIPDYDQIAFDYDGVECRLIHRTAGYVNSLKGIPDINIHFDIENSNDWFTYFDSLRNNERVIIDTINHTLIMPEGGFMCYELDEHTFRLQQKPFTLVTANDPNLYFDLNISTDPLINNTVITVDEHNPPSDIMQMGGSLVAHQMIEQIQPLANMDHIRFQLIGGESEEIKAIGRIDMREKEGSAIVESLFLGNTALHFLIAH